MGGILAVTGAAGLKSGLAFTKLLIEHNDIIQKMFPSGVRLLVRKPERLTGVEANIENCSICVGDLGDASYVNEALKNADTVVHIAGITASLNVVKAAVDCGVRRLILVHTTGIYSKYKQAGENYRSIDAEIYKMCKAEHIKLTILRPTMIYGNTTDNNVVVFIKMVDKLPLMPVVNGARYELQPVHYSDLARAYYSVLINEESTADRDFILSGGERIQLRDMLSVIGEKLGKKVRFISCPFPIAYIGAWGLYAVSLGSIDYRERVQRLCEPRVFSFDEAREAFGYEPMTFRTGIADEVLEYMKTKR